MSLVAIDRKGRVCAKNLLEVSFTPRKRVWIGGSNSLGEWTLGLGIELGRPINQRIACWPNTNFELDELDGLRVLLLKSNLDVLFWVIEAWVGE